MKTFYKLLFFSLFPCTGLFAQNLSEVQQGKERAPANVKIDGLLSEWDESLLTYNPSNRLFYTISNDEKNIYLVIKAVEFQAALKAMSRGVNFTVWPNSSKKSEFYSVTYPSFENRSELLIDMFYESRKYRNFKPEDRQKSLASLSVELNKNLQKLYKEIDLGKYNEFDKIRTLSIFNTEGIKAAGKFNDKMEYVYELAIPLNGILINSRIEYKLILIGSGEKRKSNIPVVMAKDPSKLPPDVAFGMYSTEINGSYIVK